MLQPCTGTEQPQPEAHRAAGARGSAVLYAGLAEAYDLAGTNCAGTGRPHPGEALDGFVAAYASAYGTRDTPDFRRLLAGQLAADPRIDRYWELAAEVITPPGEPARADPRVRARLAARRPRVPVGDRADRLGPSSGQVHGRTVRPCAVPSTTVT